MTPTDFPEKNVTLIGPPNLPQCRPLPVHRTPDGRVISKWSASEEDKRRFMETGEIWLHVHSGVTQPPVYVGTENPFQPPPEKPKLTHTVPPRAPVLNGKTLPDVIAEEVHCFGLTDLDVLIAWKLGMAVWRSVHNAGGKFPHEG